MQIYTSAIFPTSIFQEMPEIFGLCNLSSEGTSQTNWANATFPQNQVQKSY